MIGRKYFVSLLTNIGVLHQAWLSHDNCKVAFIVEAILPLLFTMWVNDGPKAREVTVI